MTAACRKSPNTATPQSSNALRSATGQAETKGHCPDQVRFTSVNRCPPRRSAGLFVANCGPMHRNKNDSFDHLVGTDEERCGNFEAERFGGLEVDHQLELDWCLDGKLARFRALEDAVGVQRRTSVLIDDIRAVRDQAADFSK
jgi:hypothetical protein